MFAEVSTGATDDITKATEIARSMVARFGMDPKLGPVAYEPDVSPLLGMPSGTDWRPRHYGEQTAAAIDMAVRGLLDEVFGRAVTILRRNRDILDAGAAELLAKETMSYGDLERLAAGLKREEAGKLEIAATQGQR